MYRTLFNQIFLNAPNVCKFRLTTWSALATAFNTRPAKKTNLTANKDNVGLFEVPELQSSDGFYILHESCIAVTDKLIDEAISTARSRKMVQVFDELSDTLCQVADLAEFIRIAHPSLVYTQAAEVACGTVSSIVEKLNTNKQLYSALKQVVKHGDKVPTNNVDDHVANLFLFDFEQCGIHLTEEERHKVVMLNEMILHLGQHFVTGAAKPCSVKKNVLPENIRHLFSIDDDNILISGLFADSTDHLAREMAYKIFLCPDKHQDYLLTELLHARNQLAQICGFPTYAHRALKGSTFEAPDMVMYFLDRLSDGLKKRAAIDFQLMSKMKNSENSSIEKLGVWDTPYYTKKAKKDWFNVTGSEYSPYFSLGTCMEGLSKLLNRLYGISLVDTTIKFGESWAPDIYKLAVTHESEGLLGYIYCDFYERDGKPNQDCHFTIRGGKILSDGSYQLPIVVLMLNLPLPRWSSPSLLTPSMVDNLFHEMGHAMHSMLARTSYQHVTGTRCSTDFAEVPSVLMEYFASDVRVLRTFARHFQTKEPMPEDMLERLCASKYLFMASEMQVQVFYSALDQFYHGKYPLKGTTTDVLAAVQTQYFSLPYVQNSAWQLRFSHLVGYGAKYYSYLVSKALASWIWHTYFDADPLSRTHGERYRYECLAHGGGKPPYQLITDFLKKEPTPRTLADSLLTEIDEKRDRVKLLKRRYSSV